ncbi:DsbA family protein [Falsibacillus pallidus]|uniref:DsbA family protein n=1 Tax=Falsibacillus pallidus TaxID=493781 RepID=UPI003D961483
MAKSNQKPSKQTPKSSARLVYWVGGIVLLVIIAIIFIGKQSNHVEKQDAFSYKNQPYLGDKSAPVNIVEFGDYKCPYCKAFNESFVPEIKKQVVDTGKAKFYFINYAFINVDSKRAAKFAETVYKELGNDTFWKFHELLYKKQPDDKKYEEIDYYTDEFLEKTLAEIADQKEVDQVVKAYQNGEGDAPFQRDMDTVKELKVQSTPTLFINGKEFNGKTFDDFIKMVNKAEKES